MEPVGQVDRVRGADNDQHPENQEEPADVRQRRFHERDRDRVRQRGRHDIGERDAGGDGQDDLEQQLHPARHAVMRAPRQFPKVVEEPDQPEADGHPQHDPHVRIAEVGPQQGRAAQRQQDQEPAHRRGSLLADEVALRPIGADRLTVALHRFEPGDDLRPKDQADRQRRIQRSPRTEGDVAEQVQRVKLFGERCQKKVKHVFMCR